MGALCLGPTELTIVLVIVILLFGVGRIGRIAGDLGGAIRALREGVRDDNKPHDADRKLERQCRVGVQLLRQPFHSGVWTHALCGLIAFRVLWHRQSCSALCVPVRAGPRAIQN